MIYAYLCLVLGDTGKQPWGAPEMYVSQVSTFKCCRYILTPEGWVPHVYKIASPDSCVSDFGFRDWAGAILLTILSPTQLRHSQFCLIGYISP